MQADKKERAKAIQGLRRTYKLGVLLKLDGMAKSTFYYNLAASRAEDPDAILKKRIRAKSTTSTRDAMDTGESRSACRQKAFRSTTRRSSAS